MEAGKRLVTQGLPGLKEIRVDAKPTARAMKCFSGVGVVGGGDMVRIMCYFEDPSSSCWGGDWVMTLFGNRAFTGVIKLKGGHKGGP